ncbi:hypothetical protein DQ04_04771000 [Trypanosoma grayi]|uniref:hypothetical protein n=1 Tax=Trypanosoma grayi TaxID=71804 RepID=UPI0004F46E00|nr:hypothetical protein DQ04_04771000 [Trypanosoma grayi]KEG09717.1 hypothetical protein DQ04_04771000 [Trypanosoma grayi]
MGLTTLRAFIEHCGRTPFSFEYQLNFSMQVHHAEGTVGIENGELTVHLNNGTKAKHCFFAALHDALQDV